MERVKCDVTAWCCSRLHWCCLRGNHKDFVSVLEVSQSRRFPFWGLLFFSSDFCCDQRKWIESESSQPQRMKWVSVLTCIITWSIRLSFCLRNPNAFYKQFVFQWLILCHRWTLFLSRCLFVLETSFKTTILSETNMFFEYLYIIFSHLKWKEFKSCLSLRRTDLSVEPSTEATQNDETVCLLRRQTIFDKFCKNILLLKSHSFALKHAIKRLTNVRIILTRTTMEWMA